MKVALNEHGDIKQILLHILRHSPLREALTFGATDTYLDQIDQTRNEQTTRNINGRVERHHADTSNPRSMGH